MILLFYPQTEFTNASLTLDDDNITSPKIRMRQFHSTSEEALGDLMSKNACVNQSCFSAKYYLVRLSRAITKQICKLCSYFWPLTNLRVLKFLSAVFCLSTCLASCPSDLRHNDVTGLGHEIESIKSEFVLWHRLFNHFIQQICLVRLDILMSKHP